MKKPDYKDLERQIAELKNDREKLIRTEQEMRRAASYLRGILDATNEGIVLIDNDLRVILTSKRTMKALGLQESSHDKISPEQLNQTIYQNLEQPAEHLRRVEQINQGNEHVSGTFLLKNGSVIDYYTRPLLIDGRKEGRIWSYRNVTEKVTIQEALSESEKSYHNIIESSPLGIHIYAINEAGDLILTGANRAADKITGIDTSRLFGKTIEEAFPYMADTELPECYKRAAQSGEPWSRTDLYYEDERIKGAFDIQAFQVSQGQMAVFFQDITARKQTEMMLQESEEKYRKIFQNIQDVYLEVAPDLTIQELSPSVSRISRYTRNDLIGRNLKELLADDTGINQFISRLLNERIFKDEDVSLKDKDGSIIHCSVNIRVEEDKNGKPIKLIGSLRDITERIKASEEILILSRALEQSPSSIVITDKSGKIEYVNPKFTRITGYTREELIGENSRILKSGYQSEEFYRYLWKTIGEGKEWYGEFLNRRKDGSTFWELASISPIRNKKGQITHYVGIKEDITERKKIENELRNAKEKAEEADRLKSAFLANMSHEIRTPMNAILGFSSLLQDEKLSPEDMQQYIGLINTKGKELMAIISDLIDISRIEAGDMSIHKVPIQINPFLEKIIKTFREEKSIIQKSQISIRHNFPEPVGPVCMSDRNRLSQVINNLLSNAYKFTSEGYIELGYQLSDEQIIFYVRDTGIGIAADKIQIIFERFRQADDSITKRFGGTGLGLSISKQIVELLGGKMWVESIPAIGSTFYFSLSLSGITIPDHKGDIAPVKDTSRRKVDFKGRKIIICEDDRSNYLFLESLIKKTGLTLVWALDGQQAVDIFRSNRDADLIIMDIRLPVKDGFQATREIRELDDKIPIIALTAFAFTDDRQKSIVAGCTDYIPKPVKPRDLTYLLNKYLKKKSPD